MDQSLSSLSTSTGVELSGTSLIGIWSVWESELSGVSLPRICTAAFAKRLARRGVGERNGGATVRLERLFGMRSVGV